MKLTVDINTDNDAFQADPIEETALIVEKVVEAIRKGHFSGPLHDVNGNKVGQWRLK